MMGSAREECRVVQEMWFVRGLRNGPPVELVAGTAGAPVPSGLVSSRLVVHLVRGKKLEPQAGGRGWPGRLRLRCGGPPVALSGRALTGAEEALVARHKQAVW
jgi:hypothetical protein